MRLEWLAGQWSVVQGPGARSSRAVRSSQVIDFVGVVKLSAATRITVTGP